MMFVQTMETNLLTEQKALSEYRHWKLWFHHTAIFWCFWISCVVVFVRVAILNGPTIARGYHHFRARIPYGLTSMFAYPSASFIHHDPTAVGWRYIPHWNHIFCWLKSTVNLFALVVEYIHIYIYIYHPIRSNFSGDITIYLQDILDKSPWHF